MSFEWVGSGWIKHMGSAHEQLDDRRAEEYEDRWGRRRGQRQIKEQMTWALCALELFHCHHPAWTPLSKLLEHHCLNKQSVCECVSVCVWERESDAMPPAAMVPPPLVWPERTRFLLPFTFIYTSCIFQLIPRKRRTWILLGLFLKDSSWSLFTPCLLFELYGCKSNQCSSSFNQTHPGNSPALHKTLIASSHTWVRLMQAWHKIFHKPVQLQQMEVPHLLKRNQKGLRYSTNSRWRETLYLLNVSIQLLCSFMDSRTFFFSSYQHTHTHTTCLFCLKAPKMFKTSVCRKKRLRMEELIKQEQQDVWSHSFMVRLVQLQNICNKHTGLHRFSQTVKASFVGFLSRLWGHTYVNTLFKLWMLVGADVSWFTSSNLYLVSLYFGFFPVE